ncbi:MAG: dephospho-CoA kinase [Gemmatimonadetes bacterium]|nr:dephospho-CoA kinase [Gemmatimonadota bacterium]
MIVGVTGGIGAGKSRVCEVFARGGAYVIEADEVGRAAVDDPGVLRSLAETFGRGILDENGVLIRRELGRRAFVSTETRDRLNAIVWPTLVEKLKDRARSALAQRPERPVVIDAALILEWGDHHELCDILVVVTAPETVRIQRAMERKGLSEAEVRERMACQLPESDKVEAADFVIENARSAAELESVALSVWRQIVKSVRKETSGKSPD